MSRPPASEPRCLRCDIATDLHAVEVKNTAWWFRTRLCNAYYRELETRRQRWMARPYPEPDSLRGVRLAAGLSVRELARRTGYSPSMISQLERGKIKSWPNYVERLTTGSVHRDSEDGWRLRCWRARPAAEKPPPAPSSRVRWDRPRR